MYREKADAIDKWKTQNVQKSIAISQIVQSNFEMWYLEAK